MGRIVGWMRGTHDLGRGRDRRAVELWKEGGEKRKGTGRSEKWREGETEEGRERGERKERRGVSKEKGGEKERGSRGREGRRVKNNFPA